MRDESRVGAGVDRREFFKATSAGLAAAAVAVNPRHQAISQSRADKNKFDRIASCSYPIRYIFKSRPRPAGAAGGSGGAQRQLNEDLKKKYGEITMLDFPQFTKDTFPGVTHMDIFSGLFGDVTDDTMFAGPTFDPSTASGKKWLDKLAQKLVQTGTKVQHISNNAPNDLAGPDETLRKAGVEVGKKWLDGAAILGAK